MTIPEFDPDMDPDAEIEPPRLGPTPDPGDGLGLDMPIPPGDPLGDLPRVARRHARLAMRLGRAGEALRPLLDELTALLGTAPDPGAVDVIPRASGLRRPGAIARFGWPRLGARVGLGVEPAVAHAIVDRLLGFERTRPEHRRQVSPVEWGVLGFVVARLLDRLAAGPGPLGPWDLYLDRVGPEPFDPDGLGPIVTLAWPVRVAPASGVVRLWVPEVLVALALVDAPPPPGPRADHLRRLGGLSATARVEAGAIVPPDGLDGLRPGDTLLIAGPPLLGTPEAPEGPVAIALGASPRRWAIPAILSAGEDGPRLTVSGPIAVAPRTPEPTAMPPSTDPSATVPDDPSATVPDAGPPPPAEVPVTLAVELGRLSLPLSRLADLRPGDVLDLDRSPLDPVDLTADGTPVARGMLVRLDTGLGVRITRVFV